ncbi:MAG TPA: HlyD family efflux transporter periplasmic adaptor subunit [Clostridiales bacterium]|nr:HlyD family efflux transporter periplasmic adaptor subunit [Clostridiales bacterium]HXK82919.1 HlyD family efflux transporter periplasmic adaptor subunit [Clostridiales bacterium]
MNRARRKPKSKVVKINFINSSVFKLAGIGAAALILIIYAAAQIYKIYSVPIKTTTALTKTVYKSAVVDIFVIRDEKYIVYDANGSVVPLVKDGTRVTGGDNVAAIFSNDADAKSFIEERQIKNEIAYYEALSKSDINFQSDLTQLNSNIKQSVLNYITAAESGKLSDLKAQIDRVRETITARQRATGEQVDYSQKLSELKSRLSALSSSRHDTKFVSATGPGYYVSTADGYENAVPFEKALELSCEEIEELIKKEPEQVPSNVRGKLISGYDFYIAAVLKAELAADLKVGSTVSINFPSSSVGEIKVKVAKISETKDGKTPVIFTSRQMSEELSQLRIERAEIRLEKHEGYAVPNSAIRIVDGEKGVYILRGNLVTFRKINITYSDDDISIATTPENPEGHLRLYDEIIVEGKNLYAGKVIS